VPEILEVEAAREVLGAHALDREIARVHAPDAWFLKRGLTPAAAKRALPGRSFVEARRRGKLLLVDTSDGGPVLGLHLGMSGRVLIDGDAAGDPLLYASNRDAPEWRRVELDPDEDRLGPDALALTRSQLAAVVTRSTAPVKAVLMDQHRIAGLGNLLTDEALWRCGIDPARPAASLDADEIARLHRAIRSTLAVLGRRGGSHTGDHMPARFPGGSCPKDGAPLLRRTIGGRTTFSCPVHQR